ncbi:MAG: CRISPR-associated endonuclease Cas2 [Hydrogenophilus sp.]|nr:CRISPR-associated endonuclease Cas2 [Hydrogenophilus sp.]
MLPRLYWVAYDISDDRERARIERCIARYGQRFQKSLFACVLDGRRLQRLRADLANLPCSSGFVALAALAAHDEIFTLGASYSGMPAESWVFGCQNPPRLS